MREELPLVSGAILLTYDNPVVALVCLFILFLVLKPFVFNKNDD